MKAKSAWKDHGRTSAMNRTFADIGTYRIVLRTREGLLELRTLDPVSSVEAIDLDRTVWP